MRISKVANSMAPQESNDIETKPTFNEMYGKVSKLLDWRTQRKKF